MGFSFFWHFFLHANSAFLRVSVKDHLHQNQEGSESEIQFSGPLPRFTKGFKRGVGCRIFISEVTQVCIRKLEDHCPQTLDSSCTKGHGDSMGLYKQVPSQRPRRQSSVVALITLLLKYRWKRQASVETELRHQHKCRLVSPAPWLLPITVARPARGLITCNL